MPPKRKGTPGQRAVTEPPKSGDMKKPQKAHYGDTKKRAVGVDDMTMLSKVQNENINDNLKLRFENKTIYTYIGHVLISVNPYRDLGIYTTEILESYTGKNRIEMPPHVFAIAEDAYRTMSAYSENQCVIISGESGAGKTEAAKKIMQYIAAVSGGGNKAEHVKDMLLATNPVLEAFGNAKTLRNNNSSRFGKYFEIEFIDGSPGGGTIHNYLLEKSRVSSQIRGERNFHIFYQLCRGASQKWQTDFSIYGPESFTYTSQAGCLDVPGMDDTQDFAETLNALKIIGVPEKEQYDLFRLVSAVLWLGNVEIAENADQAYVTDPSTLAHVAYLLEVPQEMLDACFRERQVETKRGGRRGTLYNVPLNGAQSAAVRDALSKSIYNRIFDWLVERINVVLSVKTNQPLVVGVLDIYGFEIFDKNGFEQLCINYVNEKLQQIFIELTLKAEQEEYEREGIQWTAIPFFNNKIVCDLIEERRPPGILAIMDDACATAHADPEAADRSLLQRLGTLSSNAHFSLGGVSFIIKHYAGDVTYDGAGMTEKNKDQLVVDLLEVINASSNAFLNKLFPEKADRDTTKKPTTAGFKIRTSCNELVEALMQCNPHYIRCIKPNESKSPTEYDTKRCLHQIRYLGLLENIRVRRAGFAYRQVHEKFLERFYLLSRRTSYAGEYTWQGDAVGGTRCILEDCGIAREEWQMGRSKTFLRHPESLWALEHLRERYWHNMAMKIQRAWRGFLRYRNECAIRVQRAYRSWVGLRTFLQMRDYGHDVLSFRKERRRFSLISQRRYLGDYVDFRSDMTLQGACGPTIGRENTIFSCRCQVLVHKLLRASKPAPRFLGVTDQAMYLIAATVEKNMAVLTLERRIPLSSIGGFSLSPYQDDYIVVHVPTEYDTVLITPFKTELVTTIAWHRGGNVQVDVQANIEFSKKPGKKSVLEFAKDEMAGTEGVLKKGKIVVASGSPSNSVSDPPCRKRQAAAQPITKGRLLKKGGPSNRPANNGAAANGGGASASSASAAGKSAGSSKGAAPVAPPQRSDKPAAAASNAAPKFRATFQYDSTDPGELSFPEGAVLEVLKKDPNGWWHAKYQGQEGWVPSNYLVEVIEAKAAPAPAAAPKRAAPAAAAAPAADDRDEDESSGRGTVSRAAAAAPKPSGGVAMPAAAAGGTLRKAPGAPAGAGAGGAAAGAGSTLAGGTGTLRKAPAAPGAASAAAAAAVPKPALKPV
ncbi:myosin-1 [Capsaspora owczarzaki ATCC 30864]|uniref:myosin-1 n=1 Tax=Capsaspora owczarzaki (strain ATCC 30864) TaxID=595528 RepID=UPI00035253DC|nr:myosin-1 [Capsaspora owczarzaki ATCC 30864]|eukprot:XP_004348329.2 myosin-1 [Capsaspora owczarzaki ATCC 30864]